MVENIIFHHAAIDDSSLSKRELTLYRHKDGVSLCIDVSHGTAKSTSTFLVPDCRISALIYALQGQK